MNSEGPVRCLKQAANKAAALVKKHTGQALVRPLH